MTPPPFQNHFPASLRALGSSLQLQSTPKSRRHSFYSMPLNIVISPLIKRSPQFSLIKKTAQIKWNLLCEGTSDSLEYGTHFPQSLPHPPVFPVSKHRVWMWKLPKAMHPEEGPLKEP